MVKIEKQQLKNHNFILGVLASPNKEGKFNLVKGIEFPNAKDYGLWLIGQMDQKYTEVTIQKIKKLLDNKENLYDVDWEHDPIFIESFYEESIVFCDLGNPSNYKLDTLDLLELLEHFDLFQQLIATKKEEIINRAIRLFFDANDHKIWATPNPHYYNIPIPDYNLPMVVSLGFADKTLAIEEKEYSASIDYSKKI